MRQVYSGSRNQRSLYSLSSSYLHIYSSVI